MTTEPTPCRASELVGRLRAFDAGPATLESLQSVVTELCCQYSYRDARDLRTDALHWLGHLRRILREPVGLRAHTELLIVAGWLALLIGCLEYDLGIRSAAEVSRRTARRFGEEAGHGEIVAWTYEMTAEGSLTAPPLAASAVTLTKLSAAPALRDSRARADGASCIVLDAALESLGEEPRREVTPEDLEAFAQLLAFASRLRDALVAT
ncbi:hypothetical protein SAMN05421678_1304 [Actinopolymorpha cephalotaxi]|uniref:Uncharacterized protein n=1 Tax=Actinopolymorpha cephalotaxi TaxID=504797 RepID=A0A1I3C6H1_9ACTN|nr:hypothetical protein [Actinopolymorpha cephalotaxi]NYH86825.1 hypothetical protein [Actinopolymorpha cephalotaxi]SFH70175.1 hypothetical protein SAMN05421678_1304 [Actinopolymorpha cephalotaxi]